jgi:FtsP/CotA-like multicopper oxidase with cupredoxin domain
VLLFQQIPYACFHEKDGKEAIKTAPQDDKLNAGRWICDERDIGEVRTFGTQMGAGIWRSSGRYTSINGIVQPTLPMKAGQVYRWRLIDAGIHETIGLTITQLDPSVKWPAKMTRQQETDLTQACMNGKVVKQFEVATDGLTRAEIVQRESNLLQPGYRSDVLFAFPAEGTYCLYDAATRTTAPNQTSVPEGPKVLGRVIVKGGTPVTEDAKAFIQKKLTKAAQARFTGAVLKRVATDLAHWKTTAFAPHKFFSPAELDALSEDCTSTGQKGQKAECVQFYAGPKDPNAKNSPIVFQINGKSFGEIETRVLGLGNAQKWVLTSKLGNHPFHIHVNPFQVVKVLEKVGDGENYKEIDYSSAAEAEYAGTVGTWKDTILVKQDHKVIIATRYQRYIGDFVLHCHLLDHEDQGMMQLVQIVQTDSEGKPLGSTHQNHSAHNTP